MKLKDILSFDSNFCVLPFIHKHITTDKKQKLCCISNDTIDDTRLVEIQSDMLDNKTIPECVRCKARETQKIFSERQFHNKEWLTKFPEETREAIIEPTTLYYDLRYSNLCNLTCQTCDSTASSSWAEKLGEDSKFFSWEPDVDINPEAKKIYLAGGEPFLIKSFSKILNEIENKDCEIVINTNATILTNHMIEALRPFSNVCFTLSIDGVGPVIERIRSGCKWETILKNIDTLQEELSPSFMVNTVLQKDNIDDIPNLAKWIDDAGIEIWHTTLLIRPEQYSYVHYNGDIDWDNDLWQRECVKNNIQVNNTLSVVHKNLS